MNTTTYTIEGMTCEGCAASLRLALGRVEHLDVKGVTIGEVTVRHEPGRKDAVVQAVEDAGFEVSATRTA